MSRLLLASRGLGALDTLSLPPRGRAVYIPTAANRFRHEAWVRELPDTLVAHGLRIREVDLEETTPEVIARTVRGADLVAVGGGDPFHLLRCCLGTAFADVLRDALARGIPYVGVSAGAMVVGPDLRPVALPSPFDPPRGLPLAGLGIVPVLVLPHDDRLGRAAMNREAAEAFPELEVLRITDEQAVLFEHGAYRVIPSVSAAGAGSPTGPPRGPRR